jgi:hypothetical protein
MELSDCGLFATMDLVHFFHEFALCVFLLGLRGAKLQEAKDDRVMRSFMVYASPPH